VVVSVPAFSERVVEDVPGAGPMEAFLTDGLRTLLETLPGARSMVERTLRWPGHVDAIRPLLESGRLVSELRERCSMDPPRDLVVLRVRVRRGDRRYEARLVERYHPATGLTAMARTTALTTSACAQLAAAGGLTRHGVQPLELVGRDPQSFETLTATLAKRGVRLDWSEA
jgi:saccharopine dehydrogenase-like NADP-dependent oxidoreductase